MSRHLSLVCVVIVMFSVLSLVICWPINWQTPMCGANSFWTPYGTDCPPNCQNGGVPPPCIKMFVPSCQCFRGFVFLQGKTGDCILLQECPMSPLIE